MNQTDQIAAQLETEKLASVAGYNSYREKLRKGQTLPPMSALISRFMAPLEETITEWLADPSQARRYGATMDFLKGMDCSTQEISFVSLWTVVHGLGYDPRGLTSLASDIGHALKSHAEYLQLTRRPNSTSFRSKLRKTSSKNKRRMFTRLVVKEGAKLETKRHELISVGAKMVDFMVQVGMVQLVNWESLAGKHIHSVTKVTYTAPLLANLREAHERCASTSAQYFPCVIPPKPWEAGRDGGFYSDTPAYRMPIVRSRHQEVQDGCLQADLSKVSEAINTLQETPWRINQQVFETALYMWEHTDGLGIFQKPEAVEIPEEPWGPGEDPKVWIKEHSTEFEAWKKARAKAFDSRNHAEGAILPAASALGRAKELQGLEKFYFCWTCDYRGRIYPVQWYLHPQGDSLCKGLLEFADAKPLGERGAYWLAIHGANSYGYDKATLPERYHWVLWHEAEILACAADPIGTRFWRELDENGDPVADSPWQFLAFCFEWAAYRRHCNLGCNPKDFQSRIAIGLDGSCNGLQHFSMLLLDPVGGEAVNLLPGPRQDIYTVVRDKVAKMVEADLDSPGTKEVEDREGNVKYTIVYRDMARIWHGKIDRKLVKRGVMTTPYGVTSLGLRQQLIDELKKRSKDYLDVENPWIAVAYLSDKLRAAIEDTVQAAPKVMDWLKLMAQLFNKAGLPMTWVSPSGWRTVQMYKKQNQARIRTYWGDQKISIRVRVSEDTDAIDPNKQRMAISPNYIHSMDSAHLVLTVLAAKEAGVAHFSMIHDSYGTHAGDTDTLNRVLRKVFCEMYAPNRLEELWEQLKVQLPADLCAQAPPPPERLWMLPCMPYWQSFFYA